MENEIFDGFVEADVRPVLTNAEIHFPAGDAGVTSSSNLASGKTAMKDCVLNKRPEPASNDTIWTFESGHLLCLERGARKLLCAFVTLLFNVL
jgi:hypothetical protein